MNSSNDLSNIISKLTENPEVMKSLMGIAGNIMNENKNDVASESFKRDDRCHDDGGKWDKRDGDDKSRDSDHDRCDDCPKDVCCRDEEEHHHGRRGDDAENLIRLLLALKPYVSRDRCEKIESIVKILKLVQLSEKTGLLKSLL